MTMHEEIRFSTLDVFAWIGAGKKTLICLVLFFSCALTLYALVSPIRYKSEASFWEKGKSTSNFDTKAAMVLINGNQRESEAEPIFKSRRVISGVIRDLGLQVVIVPGPQEPPLLKRLICNLYIEWAYFRNYEEPLFADYTYPFKVTCVDYPYDQKRSFTLTTTAGVVYLKDKGTFQEFSGRVGEPLIGDNFTITIEPQKGVEGQIYTLSLLPFTKTVKDTVASLKIQADKNDKSLIKLSYSSSDRWKAKAVLDGLMVSYLNYLEEEQQIIHDKQITYLENRQKESFECLKKKMELHAQEIAKDALLHGFIGSDKAIQFYAAHQEQLQAKKEQVELQIKALRDMVHEEQVPLERLSGLTQIPLLTEKIQEIQHMRSFRDSLALALWDRGAPPDKEKFLTKVEEWESLQNEAFEIDRLMKALEEKGTIESHQGFEEKTDFFLNFWKDQLNRSLTALNGCPKEDFYPLLNHWCRKKNSFRNYLLNLKNYIDVQSVTVQEELIHSKEIDEEFKGIDLSVSQELFKRYIYLLEELQAQERHLGFLQAEIKKADFRISSLSTIIEDKVALELVHKAAALEMAIQDPKNRSEKEQLRMGDELELQREFLQMHLGQTLALGQIRQGLIREKIGALQGATLGFLHRQISFLEHQIKGMVEAKIEAFEQEKGLYLEQIKNLGDQLATFPEKWVRDELLKQAMQVQQLQAQEITRLTETKNITANLELVQSSPLDRSFLPPLPMSPMAPLFALLGAVLGFVIGVGSLLATPLFKGIPATKRNLELQGQIVLGSLSEHAGRIPLVRVLDKDLETFRNILSDSLKRGHKVLLVVGDRGGWAVKYTQYLVKNGKKTLFLSLDFNTPFKEKGLMDFLKGQVPFPDIHTEDSLDRINFQGTSRSWFELLSQKSFQELLEKLKIQYDFVLASLPVESTSPFTSSLSKLFDASILTIHKETLEALQPSFNWNNPLFIFENSNPLS